MGVIKKSAKAVGKTIGTTVLTVTGISSSVLKTCADSVGFELGSTVFGSAKKASFKGIRKMWHNKKADEYTQKIDSTSKLETLRIARDGYLNRATAAKRIVEMAIQNGNDKKKNEYEAEYERCMRKYKDLDLQYRNAIKQKIAMEERARK